MRGQEYTVMNYLVWTAFAVAFLIAVYSVYNTVVAGGCKTSWDQILDLLHDAAKLDVGCIQTRGEVILCPGTMISPSFVKNQMGVSSVTICAGRGVIVENGIARAEKAVKATVSACRCGNAAKLCINSASCMNPCGGC